MSVDEIRKIYYTEKGIEKGIEKGSREEKLRIAKSLLDLLDISIIAEKTGLTEDEVRKLKH